MASRDHDQVSHSYEEDIPLTDDEDTEDEEDDDDYDDETEFKFSDNKICEDCWSPFNETRFSREKWIKEWDRVFALVCALGLFVDPFFFYTLSVNESCMCLFIDGWYAVTVTVLRSMADVFHVCNMWMQFKLYKPLSTTPGADDKNSSALRYLKGKKGFFLYLFAILPLPQVLLWLVTPALLEKGKLTTVMTLFLVMFVFHYCLKVCHSLWLLHQMQNLSGYIYGTVWWGLALNLVAYCVISHALGACCYVIGLQRFTRCLTEECMFAKRGCSLHILTCEKPIFYGTTYNLKNKLRLSWAENKQVRSVCFQEDGGYDYGGLKWVLQLISNESRMDKFLLPLFWGFMFVSTFGNLKPTTDSLEIIFIAIVIAIGLILVTMLIANIRVFINSNTTKKRAMKLKWRNTEWWMKRRNLPQEFRQRVRNYERQRWATTRGVDECDIIENLPEGLRRDIKYHLCLDLVKQVPFFQHMDNLVLENICDRVKSLIFTKGETIMREGDPVQRMLFIVRGHLQCCQVLRDGVQSSCMLGPGNFSGDELLSWGLKRPFVERLPPSSSTLTTLENTEAFVLEAKDVKYVIQHFRYTFVSEKVKRSARYYSPGWRTWAAVTIQMAWRRYKHPLMLTSSSFIRPMRPWSRSASLMEERLRIYTALLTSPKPNQDDLEI